MSQVVTDTHLSQFGLVHHFTKLGSGEYYLEELENEICRMNEKQEKKSENRKGSFYISKTVIVRNDNLISNDPELKSGISEQFARLRQQHLPPCRLLGLQLVPAEPK